MLRVMLCEHIVNDIRTVNEKGRNPKVRASPPAAVFDVRFFFQAHTACVCVTIVVC